MGSVCRWDGLDGSKIHNTIQHTIYTWDSHVSGTLDTVRRVSHFRVLTVVSFLCRICGSADLFGQDTSSGFPGTLAAARRPCYGYNAASVLDSSPLSETVASILSSMAPPDQHDVLKRTLLFASMMSGVREPRAL